jgi:hemerythrin
MPQSTVWQDAYSVGHPLLDEQHKELLALCVQAEHCCEDRSPAGTRQFHQILDALIGYTSRHFRTEERILRECAYPGYKEHHTEHGDYEVRLTAFLLDASSGTIDKQQLHAYLWDWWSSHILDSDMKYKGKLTPKPDDGFLVDTAML